MKKMIRMAMMTAAVFMAVTTVAKAQGGGGGRGGNRVLAVLKDSLKVSDAIVAKADSIKALLTDDQKAAFDKIMAAMPQGRRGGPPPPTR